MRINIRIAGLLAAVLICALVLPLQPAFGQGHLDLGSTAPALSGTDLTGSDLSLGSLRGKWVYIDFWASWCAPCMSELPEVIGLQQRLGIRSDFDVISVSLDSSATVGDLRRVVEDYQIPYPVVYSDQGGASPVISSWNVKQIPSTFLINPGGVIVARDLKPQEVEERLPLLQESTYAPIKLISENQLRKISAISGLSNYRDLHIDIEMEENASPISRYQVFVSTACDDHNSGGTHFDVQYDLRVAAIERENKTRFAVDIRKTSGASYIDGVSSTVTHDITVPDMAVVIDEYGSSYSFIVPVPSCSNQLTYAVALYDEQVNDFVRNGMTTLEVQSGY